jgi:HTH-type transcriptional regulator, competence development regulator
MDFNNYLKTKREEKNLSKNKLGELSGVSAMYISQIERGMRVTPSPKILEKLADGLNEPYEELMEAAGYITKREMDVEDFIEELRETIKKGKEQQERVNIETRSFPQEQFELDYLLSSEQEVFFESKLLTQKEKSKIKSLIEIVLKD